MGVPIIRTLAGVYIGLPLFWEITLCRTGESIPIDPKSGGLLNAAAAAAEAQALYHYYHYYTIIVIIIMNPANTIMNASINTLGRQVEFMSFDVLASQDIASKLPPGG